MSGAKTWETAATAAADKIFCYPIVNPFKQLHDLTDVDQQLGQPSPNFFAIGSFALEASTRLSAHVLETAALDEILKTVIAKQHDYGHHNILRHGITGVVVRMCDKVERIRNLERRAAPANESLVDSWRDLVGYSIIAVMLLAGSFELPLAADVVG